MASRVLLLTLAGLAAVAQTNTMPGMDMSTTTSGDATITNPPTAVATSAEADLTSTMTSMPSVIMPFDVSASLSGSTTPSTLVLDTMKPPSPSSTLTWEMATSGNMYGTSKSGMAMSTGMSSTSASSTGTAPVNEASSVYKKISMSLLALCIVASIAAQM